ncbi:GNAT family N-acetyltransferase [Silvanigrella aquatica]|uniref:N-acetyltransferase domain-containing protein n=1 Tax=Silvanigrella aquatica TaxID=1915309 RepID=A0A1L4CYT4_9BACT|nr:GNAT family protein [Silvanigrella aquatica]APJ03114.1 hypothetical protein AXG55_04000 [Silvanigrella aquatica]
MENIIKIYVDNDIYLSEFMEQDQDELVLLLNEKEFSENTGTIPFPYELVHSKNLLLYAFAEAKKFKKIIHFAIRNQEGKIIGSIGFEKLYKLPTHQAEIGYWLSKKYWGQGIMPKVIQKVCEYGFSELSLARISAMVFIFNIPSCKVLEKSGFIKEGVLRNFFLQNGNIFDGVIYSKIKHS